MTRRKALEWRETKVGNYEVIPQALWPIAKSLMKRDGSKAPTAVRGPLEITYHPNEKANAIADCLENNFTSHDLCDENHERRAETRVQVLLPSVDDTPSEKLRLCDIQELVKMLKFIKACGFDSIQNECLRYLPRRPLVHLIHLFNCCLCSPIFPSLGRK
jgi:hypothetical protein